MTEMSPAEAVFFAAAALPAADREAYLDRVCADNDDLRRRVERMLAARLEVGDFLEPAKAAPVADATATFAPVDSAAGTFSPDSQPSAKTDPTEDYIRREEHAGAVIGGKYTLVEGAHRRGRDGLRLAGKANRANKAVRGRQAHQAGHGFQTGARAI